MEVNHGESKKGRKQEEQPGSSSTRFADIPARALLDYGLLWKEGRPRSYSEREELPHLALALDLNGHALTWIGMFHAGSGKPSFHVSFHSRPGDAPFLAASR